MARTSLDLKAPARMGAQTRLKELEEERKAILKTFPDLRRGAERAASADNEAPRRRRRLSAAQRRAISARMKKYWAKRRKAKAGAKT